jgi:hypothetical protein
MAPPCLGLLVRLSSEPVFWYQSIEITSFLSFQDFFQKTVHSTVIQTSTLYMVQILRLQYNELNLFRIREVFRLFSIIPLCIPQWSFKQCWTVLKIMFQFNRRSAVHVVFKIMIFPPSPCSPPRSWPSCLPLSFSCPSIPSIVHH